MLDWNERAIRVYDGIGATVMADWRICRTTGDALAALAARATGGRHAKDLSS